MKAFSTIFTLLIIMSFSLSAQDPNFHIYLCFGQSNMEGSAEIQIQDKTVDHRFKVMASMDCPDLGRLQGQWYIAQPPLSQCGVGLSPADYFGRTMVESLPDSITIGVVNVAIGGCDIRLFDKGLYSHHDSLYGKWFTDKIEAYGGNPYDRLISLAKLAKKDGCIKGILLHQGETNTGDVHWPAYVSIIYRNILNDLALDANQIPLLVGEVAHKSQGGKCASMNSIINTLPEKVSTAHIISSEGCEIYPDCVHFNSVGVRELGKRYADKMMSLNSTHDL